LDGCQTTSRINLENDKSDRRGCAHLFRPMYPDFLHGAPPTAAHAAFIKESRMRVVDASQLDRKSGVRPTARRGKWCERGASFRFPPSSLRDEPLKNSCVHRFSFLAFRAKPRSRFGTPIPLPPPVMTMSRSVAGATVEVPCQPKQAWASKPRNRSPLSCPGRPCRRRQ
jgi:hypothetical protein